MNRNACRRYYHVVIHLAGRGVINSTYRVLLATGSAVAPSAGWCCCRSNIKDCNRTLGNPTLAGYYRHSFQQQPAPRRPISKPSRNLAELTCIHKSNFAFFATFSTSLWNINTSVTIGVLIPCCFAQPCILGPLGGFP